MKLLIKKGATSYLTTVWIQDSSSTVGAGLTGLTSGTASFVCYRARSDDGNAGGTQISLSGGTLGTWSSGGFKEKDATNMPGLYEFGIPNAAIASGSNYCVIMFKGGTNVAPVLMEIQLVEWDPQNANFGMTNVSSNVVQWNGSSVAAPNIAGVPKVDVTDWLGTAVTAATAGIPDVNTKNYNNVAATTDANNLPKVDVEDWKAGIVPATNVTGVPLIDLKYTLGTLSPAAAGSVSPDWGQVVNPTSTVGLSGTTIGHLTANADKTGYSLTQTFPTNFSSMAIDSNGNVATQSNLKKNTASSGFMVVMTDSTNHAPLTGATVTGKVSIDGGAFATLTNSVTEVANGTYTVNLAAADTNGNHLMLRFTATGADDVNIEMVTTP